MESPYLHGKDKRRMRRNKREQLKKQAKVVLGDRYHPSRVDTGQPCSCHMCGNQRKYLGESFKQQKEKASYEDYE